MTAMTTAPPPSPSTLLIAKPSGSRAVANVLATVLVTGAFLVALIPLLWIIYTVISRGASLLLDVNWWTQSQRGITTRQAGGGAYHAILGSLMQAGVTALISVPIGILTAIYLVEYGRGRFARLVSFMVDILTGVPSIVAGLFIYAVWVSTLGFQRVGFAVSLALVLLMVPVIVRSTEEMLKVVPNELREASYALGVPKWRTIASVVVPTALTGIVTGVMLGLARVMGETAPLLILGPYNTSIATDLFKGNMATLPTMINVNRSDLGLPTAYQRVWAAALTLILVVLVLNILARIIARYNKVS